MQQPNQFQKQINNEENQPWSIYKVAPPQRVRVVFTKILIREVLCDKGP